MEAIVGATNTQAASAAAARMRLQVFCGAIMLGAEMGTTVKDLMIIFLDYLIHSQFRFIFAISDR